MEIRRHKKLKNIEYKESGRNGRKFVSSNFYFGREEKVQTNNANFYFNQCLSESSLNEITWKEGITVLNDRESMCK